MPRIDLTGALDGFALWLDGRCEAVFPTFMQAAKALQAARAAAAQLAAPLTEDRR